MRPILEVFAWVVYRMTINGKSNQVNAVCSQTEWDEMEAQLPGYHTLIRSGITSEPEAEKLARGTVGDKLRSLPSRL